MSPVVIKIIDENGDDIPYDRMDAKPYYIGDGCCDCVTIQLLSELGNVTETELKIIGELIEDRLKYGNSVDMSRRLLELHDKIRKLIERKDCE